ncbi:hypothetical protein Tco_0635408 [Tanacetum coccineum]
MLSEGGLVSDDDGEVGTRDTAITRSLLRNGTKLGEVWGRKWGDSTTVSDLVSQSQQGPKRFRTQGPHNKTCLSNSLIKGATGMVQALGSLSSVRQV